VPLFEVAGIILTATALFGYINYRFLGLPDTLGMTAVGLLVSAMLTIIGFGNPVVAVYARNVIAGINFPEVVFHGMLSLLLFAGALHVQLRAIARHALWIAALATVGVLLSTVLVGFGFYYALQALGRPLELSWCLLFGALISPTDPIAVLSVLKHAGAPKTLETQITGESLFNDGTGVVTFLAILGIATGTMHPSASSVALLLLTEVAGGLLLGAALGYLGVLLLKGVDSYAVEIMITLALATAGYSLAEHLHVSAPLAVVVAGLLVGNIGASSAMSESTRTRLFPFWELLDDLLNLVLFGLIGLEVVALSLRLNHIWVGLAALPIVLVARWISVGAPSALLRRFIDLSPHAVKIMTWGGLRGGISIALALTLPEFAGRDMIISATYIVVIFSLLVQATTLGPFIKALKVSGPGEPARPIAEQHN
jgi:monovalent cation:H+ antiporter, CPA1 family